MKKIIKTFRFLFAFAAILLQLQNSLIGVGPSGWNGWRDKIKNNYNNPTESFVDELFSNWQD